MGEGILLPLGRDIGSIPPKENTTDIICTYFFFHLKIMFLLILKSLMIILQCMAWISWTSQLIVKSMFIQEDNILSIDDFF